MARAGIKFTYSNGGPESITDIVCLSSWPRLKGTVILTPFYNLTAFDGGRNDLEDIIGITSLTALKSFKIGDPFQFVFIENSTERSDLNTVSFNLSALPSSLKTFEAFGLNKITGDISSLPSGLTHFRLGGSNTTTGNLTSLPDNINVYTNGGFNTVYNYYNGAKLGFGQKVWTNPGYWVLEPTLSSGGPGMSPYHLATLIIDLSSATWTTPNPPAPPIKFFVALNEKSPALNLLDYSYGPQLSAAIDAIRAKSVTVFVNLTSFLDPDAEAYKALIA